MVSRIMISLRKSVDLQQEGWSVELPEDYNDLQGLEFIRPSARGTNWTEDVDEIPLYPDS